MCGYIRIQYVSSIKFLVIGVHQRSGSPHQTCATVSERIERSEPIVTRLLLLYHVICLCVFCLCVCVVLPAHQYGGQLFEKVSQWH